MNISNTNITKAVEILQRGGLVAMPTETVYGLAADAKNEAAVRGIFKAKERPFDHPLIVHLAQAQQIEEWAREIPASVWRLAEQCWPGPLTLILKKQAHVLDIVTGHQDTIGIRIPRHPIAQALLQAFGSGLAAPSANKFTHISPTTAAAVQEELGDRIELILDGGDCVVGLESTILDMTSEKPRILRPGMLSVHYLSHIIEQPIHNASHYPERTRVPGQHHLHYAPVTRTRLMTMQEIQSYVQSTLDRVAVITHSGVVLFERNHIHHVSISSEPAIYAHELYKTLRLLDQQRYECILVEAVPETEAWDGIRDRLSKATAR
jgi:L-threonylcarbamoyladenylate synthase